MSMKISFLIPFSLMALSPLSCKAINNFPVVYLSAPIMPKPYSITVKNHWGDQQTLVIKDAHGKEHLAERIGTIELNAYKGLRWTVNWGVWNNTKCTNQILGTRAAFFEGNAIFIPDSNVALDSKDRVRIDIILDQKHNCTVSYRFEPSRTPSLREKR